MDNIRSEAPESYKTYHPDKSNKEELVRARSLALIHLLLKVKFGVVDFLERHKLITDGPQDGGVDAYCIDSYPLFFDSSLDCGDGAGTTWIRSHPLPPQ